MDEKDIPHATRVLTESFVRESALRNQVRDMESRVWVADEHGPMHVAFAEELMRMVGEVYRLADDDGMVSAEALKDYLSERAHRYRTTPIEAFTDPSPV